MYLKVLTTTQYDMGWTRPKKIKLKIVRVFQLACETRRRLGSATANCNKTVNFPSAWTFLIFHFLLRFTSNRHVRAWFEESFPESLRVCEREIHIPPSRAPNTTKTVSLCQWENTSKVENRENIFSKSKGKSQLLSVCVWILIHVKRWKCFASGGSDNRKKDRENSMFDIFSVLEN